MKLQTIDKARYRQHLNRLIAACAGSLLCGSLAISTLLIFVFSSSDGVNFYLNLGGVVISGFSIVALLSHFKHHPLMLEVFYVWQLKQQLNKINRKIMILDKAAAQDNIDALIILNYSYQGSMQLWQLDDNTITLDVLNLKMVKLNQQITDLNLTISSDDYNQSLLQKF